jgi:hypothetical protein
MRSICIRMLVTLIAELTCICSFGALAQSNGGKTLEDIQGIELQRIELQGEHTAHIAWVDLDIRKVRVLVPGFDRLNILEQRLDRITGLPIKGYLVESMSQLVLSGGFMSSFFPPIPLGYVQIDGRAVNRKHVSRQLNGVFCAAPGRAAVTLWDSDFDPVLWRDCLQGGPLLISDRVNILDASGLPDVFVYEPLDRAFVGVDEGGRVALGIVEDIRLDELAELLRKGRFGQLIDVLNLAGSGSAGLTWRSQDGSIRLVGNGREFLATAIAAE